MFPFFINWQYKSLLFDARKYDIPKVVIVADNAVQALTNYTTNPLRFALSFIYGTEGFKLRSEAAIKVSHARAIADHAISTHYSRTVQGLTQQILKKNEIIKHQNVGIDILKTKLENRPKEIDDLQQQVEAYRRSIADRDQEIQTLKDQLKQTTAPVKSNSFTGLFFKTSSRLSKRGATLHCHPRALKVS